MGELYQSTKQPPKRTIICCPVCGEHLPESPIEPIEQCPNCEFDLNLIRLPLKRDIPPTSPAYIPRFSLIILGLQSGLGGLFSILFLLFASPLYGSFTLLIAAINVISIPVIVGFVFILRTQKATGIVRIALVVLGIATLPLGVCALTAAFGIVSIQRWCIVCGKKIGWSSYLECPNCRTTIHRWGKCRGKRLQLVATSLDAELSTAQLEYICPNCFQPMNQHDLGGKTNE
jgi:predicted RNA-binding Zn-ribbon protein involved in translation (DUF1610 family)